MKETKYLFSKLLFSIILFFILSISCSDERALSINPNKQARTSFELTDTDENTINVIDILAFRVDENDNTKEYFAYKTKSKDIVKNETTGKNSFNATLIKSGDIKYRFVIIANAESEVEALGDISNSSLKEEVLKQLTSYNADKWITDKENNNYKNIPMWAETPQMIISDNTNSIKGLHLIRMLSRIDVVVDPSTQSAFKLTSIRVYNYNTYGQIAPNTNAGNWDGEKAIKPTLPDNPGTEIGPLLYSEMSTPNIALNKGIYLFESAGLPDSENANVICLIIGGEYNNEGKETYYKVNFRNADKNIDLLRNYLYTVKIKQIQNSGYDTPEDAFLASAVNITPEIIVWDQGELKDIVTDGEYFLGVNNRNFIFPLDANQTSNPNYQLIIGTNEPSGWTIEKIVDSEDNSVGWITTGFSNGSGIDKAYVDIFVSENTSELDRTAFIHIKAGRMTQIVEVLQNTIPEIKLLIVNENKEEVSELIFGSHVGESVPPQLFTVSWLPQTAINSVEVSNVPNTTSFNFGSGDIIFTGSLQDPSGIKTYSIQPASMTLEEINQDPFLEKTSRIDYTVSNGVTYESKTIFLSQKHYDAVPTVDVNFAMDGTEQYFTIRANAPWEIEVTNDPLNIVQELITTFGGTFEDKRIERVYLRTNDYNSNPDIIEGDITLTIKSTNPERSFPNKTVTIKCYSGEVLPASNTYLVYSSNTAGKGFLIPVSRANEAFPGSIGPEDNLEAYFVWTDDQNHLTTTILEPVGRGNTGYLYMFPGAPQGNDVVAVRVNGVIKWSWHLWIANYDPLATSKTLGGYTIMDRNIGTLNASPGNKYAMGTYYQWGRKDAFPPAIGTTTSSNEKIYNKSGEITSIVNSPSTEGLAFATSNPLVYMNSSSGWTGSAGANSWENGGKKTIYDPCPPGWKVAIPAVYASLTTANFVWDNTNRGRTHSTGGWFPASGIRGGTSTLGSVGAIGGYFTSAYGSPFVPTLDFKSTTVTPNMNYNYTDGCTIRCMRE